MTWKTPRFVLLSAIAAVLVSSCAGVQPTEQAASISPVIDRIVARKELVVGTEGNMPPFNVTNRRGEVIGFEVDLATRMARSMQVNLRIETMPFAELLPAVKAGTIDLALSDITMTPRRNLEVGFVGPYYMSGKSILSKREKLGSARKMSDLNTPSVVLVALENSTSQEFIERLLPNATLRTTKNYDEAVAMVLSDEVNALVAEHPFCVVTILRNPQHDLGTLEKPFTEEPIGIAFSPRDPLLHNFLVNFLESMLSTGELKKLHGKWFEDGAWLNELP